MSGIEDGEQHEDQLREALVSLQSLGEAGLPSIESVWELLNEKTRESHAELNDEYKTSLAAIGGLVRRMNPLDVHTVAAQTLLLTEQQIPLMLLLCIHSLHRHPSNPKRWKRWQSVCCETIKLFQRNPSNVLIWIRHLDSLRANWLPPEALHVGIVAGLVGTTTFMVESYPQHALSCLQALEPILGNDIMVLLGHPWREQSLSKLGNLVVIADDEQDEEEHHPIVQQYLRSQLSWWTFQADSDDSVVNMRTSWSNVGVALMAAAAWNSRPLLYTPFFQWRMWFPHVQNLLLLQGENAGMVLQGMELLENALRVTPIHALSCNEREKGSPIDPVGTMQLLCNEMLSSQQSPTKLASVSGLLQGVVERYQPAHQIKLVQRLMEDCPQPGLVPRLLDLLRPLVLSVEDTNPAAAQVWTLLDEDYFQPLCGKQYTTEELLEQVELHVAALTMLRLQLLIRKAVPVQVETTIPQLVESVLPWLSGRIRGFERNPGAAPDQFFRLNILQLALEQVQENFEALA